MADDTNKEVSVDFRSLRPLGEFKAEWNGKFKKTDTFQFVVRFDNLNSTAAVDFERNSAGNEQRLHLEFTVERVLKLDAKLTLYFSNGSGTWLTAGKSPKSLSDQSMICFIVGPEMSFGVELPHVMLHECAKGEAPLRTIRLKRPLELDD